MIKPANIQVRFSDLDVLGHVNNSVYLSYFEMARVHYFGQLLGYDWDWQTNGAVLVKSEVEYIQPILLEHHPLIFVSVDEIGTKSFTLSYEIKVEDHIYTRGKSKLVCFNIDQQKTIKIPERMLKALDLIKLEQ